MKIGDYFSSIERSLRRVKGAELDGQITSLASDDFNGLLRCRVFFWDASYLDIYEVERNRDAIEERIDWQLPDRVVGVVQDKRANHHYHCKVHLRGL